MTLTRGEQRCLAFITRCDFTGKGIAITEEELAAHLGYRRPYVCSLVKGLERKGRLGIEKRRHPGSKWTHNFYRVKDWNPHVRRGICNLRREFKRLREEASEHCSDTERTATACEGATAPRTPSLDASKALPARSQAREARCSLCGFEIQETEVHRNGRGHVGDLLCENCEHLVDQLEAKAREVQRMAEMNQSLQDELVGSIDTVKTVSKENANLRRQLTKQQKQSAKREQVDEIVEHWQSHGRFTKFPLGGKNRDIIEKALVLMEEDEEGAVKAVKEAIDGLHLAPFEQYGRRYGSDAPGRTLRREVVHALGDENRIARCREIAQRARFNGDGWLMAGWEAACAVEQAWTRKLLDRIEGRPEESA